MKTHVDQPFTGPLLIAIIQLKTKLCFTYLTLVSKGELGILCTKNTFPSCRERLHIANDWLYVYSLLVPWFHGFRINITLMIKYNLSILMSIFITGIPSPQKNIHMEFMNFLSKNTGTFCNLWSLSKFTSP